MVTAARGMVRTLAGGLAAILLAASTGSVRADVTGPTVALERLRAELHELRSTIPVQAVDASRLARYEVRLGRLEEELGRLTGRIERLEFEQRQLGERFEQLVGDLDNRLRGLEGNQPLPAEEPPGESGMSGELVAPDVPLSQERDSADAAARPAPPEGGLGTVPESAILDLPRADPGAAEPPRRTSLPPQEQYDAAMELLRAGNYAAAESGLELFLELNPDHPLAGNAAYWLAETHYVRRNYAAAAGAFARNYRTYGRDAAKAADNLLKLGMSLQGLGENDKACRSYDELASEFPSAPAHIRQALSRERARAQCV